ncbi:MAG TPA: hypothetical protein VN902_23495 [Candidatus Acidoferrales bacterium]|jgi:hypothetical protein|nr:hypothetical protein [Candidatus Acidoferrales bacterium]
MTERTPEANPFNWRLVACAALVAFAVCFTIAVCQADTALFLYLFLVGPGLIAFSIALAVYAFVGKGRRIRPTLLSAWAAVWAVTAVLFVYHAQVRTKARWLVWSHDYKEKVLTQQAPANGEFRHTEWDGWGWGGEDTTVFLVFDPENSLSSAASIHQPGKFDGIPCAVPEVSRLESQWYAVRFYTDQDWQRCN